MSMIWIEVDWNLVSSDDYLKAEAKKLKDVKVVKDIKVEEVKEVKSKDTKKNS